AGERGADAEQLRPRVTLAKEPQRQQKHHQRRERVEERRVAGRGAREPEEEEPLVERDHEEAQPQDLRDVRARDALVLPARELDQEERDRGQAEAQERGRERADRGQRGLPDEMSPGGEDLIQNERE